MGKTEAPAWLDWMQNSADSCDWINYLSICGFSDRRPRRWRFFGCDKGHVPALPPRRIPIWSFRNLHANHPTPGRSASESVETLSSWVTQSQGHLAESDAADCLVKCI